MTGEEKPTDKPANDDDVEFDMYHFFSRWDVLLVAGVILALLVWLLYHFLHAAPGA